MSKEIADLMEQWLEHFSSWETARNYNGLIKRIIRLEIVPNLPELSLEEFNKIDHKKVVTTFKTNKAISVNSRTLYAGVYNSLVRYIQVHQGLLCCVHECKKAEK